MRERRVGSVVTRRPPLSVQARSNVATRSRLPGLACATLWTEPPADTSQQLAGCRNWPVHEQVVSTVPAEIEEQLRRGEPRFREQGQGLCFLGWLRSELEESLHVAKDEWIGAHRSQDGSLLGVRSGSDQVGRHHERPWF